MEIRKIKEEDFVKALELVWRTFLEYENPTEEAKIQFNKSLNDKNWISEREFYGAFENDKILGVIALKNFNHIALFFVDKNYHRQGIGKKLFQKACELNQTGYYTVNSSSYATVVYEHLGFSYIDNEKCINGVKFYPMKNNNISKYKIK